VYLNRFEERKKQIKTIGFERECTPQYDFFNAWKRGKYHVIEAFTKMNFSKFSSLQSRFPWLSTNSKWPQRVCTYTTIRPLSIRIYSTNPDMSTRHLSVQSTTAHIDKGPLEI